MSCYKFDSSHLLKLHHSGWREYSNIIRIQEGKTLSKSINYINRVLLYLTVDFCFVEKDIRIDLGSVDEMKYFSVF